MYGTAWVILFVVLAAVRISGQATGNGEIIGQIRDVQGGAIPGARVSIASGDDRSEMMTDAEGRFAFRSLTIGTYNVAVELPGFFTGSGVITLSPTLRRAHVGWHLEVGCFAQGSLVYITRDPREAAPVADAIVHVQAKSEDGPMLWSSRPECPGGVVQSYTVEVLNVVARRRGSVERGATLQLFQPTHGVRFQPGEEYVVLMGTGLILQIVSGRISSRAGGTLTGLEVQEALEALGQWSREGSQ